MTTAQPSRSSFPIAAIGASAGGLAPTSELVRELGATPGIALVVVHHLDPTHESGLVDILSRATAMPVAAAVDGVRVERDHVYVVPPNAGLLIRQGILRVVPRPEGTGLHLPIDRFCESLALDLDGQAVGVVLSGSGFDGTEGIRAIKREGGLTLAQDSTAAFASMPESAVATGCVDFILPPSELARQLVRIGASASSLHAIPPPGAEERDYPQILALMRTVSGVDFTSYKHSTIRRRLQRRLLLHGLSDLGPYLELLGRDPAELAALCEEVLIHVTGFFREPDVFEALRHQVLPKLLENRSRDAPIRVWVPGCSTGEEVYSLAIVLLEFLEQVNRDVAVKVFGTDLSAATIEKARAGRYPQSIERDVSAGRLQRFFTKDAAGYAIRRDVRDLCVFAKHDVTRDPPFSAMDLVSCRNLMIYLGPELQDRVVALLHYALREPGFLLLGSAETVRAFAGFAPVDGKNKIYARTSAAARLGFDFAKRPWPPDLPFPGAVVASDRSSDTKSPGASDVHRHADRLVLEAFAPPGVVITSDLAIVQFRGQTAPFLEPAPGVPTFDLLRMAREELRLPLRRAIDQARSSQSPAREAGVGFVVEGTPRTVTLEVIPFSTPATQQRFFLVLFEQDPPGDAAKKAPAPAPATRDDSAESALRRELASNRRYMESVIEQLEAANEELKAANEEIVSSNEELRSTNEELQGAKEELQATNEELRTVNDELAERNAEATRLNDDLTNVLSSLELPILIVGRDLRLRRFTPAAAKSFDIDATDLGRPVGDIPGIVGDAPVLVRLVPEVLAELRPAQCTATDSLGRWQHILVRPYVTLDGRIDGTVVTVRDVDAETRAAERIAVARRYAESIIETVSDSLVVLDREQRLTSANAAFLQVFGLDGKSIQGRRIEELGRPELAAPTLREMLGELGDGPAVASLRLNGGDDGDGGRVFRVRARHIEGTELTLIALEDVTNAERLADLRREARGERSLHERLRGMAFDSAVTEERERRRLAVELHDGIGQDLALAKMKLEPLRDQLANAMRETLNGVLDLLTGAIRDTRTMVFELSPPILYDLGLEKALAWLVEDLQTRHGLHVELTDDGADKPLDDAAKAIVFRAVRELFVNVLKHAKVTVAEMSIRRDGGWLGIDVADGGVGFDVAALDRPDQRGFGLLSVREQILRIGGTLSVETAPRSGTVVRVRIPLKAADTST